MIMSRYRNLFKKIMKFDFKEFSYPEKPLSQKKIGFRLEKILKNLKSRNLDHKIGEPHFFPNPIAVSFWSKFLAKSPNQLGNWSIKGEIKLHGTHEIEREVIYDMISLLKGDQEELEGYITSGATEGNIFSAWIGRKSLEKNVSKESICLVRSDLTHYSITKAADIIGVPDFITPLDENKWNISIIFFIKTIMELYKKGYKGFLIPFTLGYTVGGTNDDYEEIIKQIRALKNKFDDIHFFTWIDAAFSGLTIPFLKDNFMPFSNPFIQTFILDFHKVAGVPYPAGLVLYKKNLRQLIEKDIPYLNRKDNTLLGSRTAAAPIAIWATINYIGKRNMKKIIQECLKQKQQFLKTVEKRFKSVRSITDENSTQAALLIKNPLPQDFCRRYGLTLNHQNIKIGEKSFKAKLYKLFFLPRFK